MELWLIKIIETTDEKNENVDLNSSLFENLSLSAEQFGKRGNRRIVAYVELQRCMSHHFAAKHDVTLEWHFTIEPADFRLLRPVIKIYREERWYELLEEALLLALDCANKAGDEESTLGYFYLQKRA